MSNQRVPGLTGVCVSTVWLVDELGRRIPGTDKVLAFRLTPQWRIESRATWTMPQAATVAGYEIVSAATALANTPPQPFRKWQELNVHVWLDIGAAATEPNARLAYMRDEISLDEFEQRIGATA